MDISLKWNNVNGDIVAIASKSDAHRALICAALADSPTKLNIKEISLDIKATISCLVSLGAKVLTEEGYITVYPISERKNNPLLDCGESGSTLRFMIPISTIISQNPKFIGHGRLAKRPLTPLISAMETSMCSFSQHSLPFCVNGSLTSGKYEIQGNVSSQFISGLMFALPLLEGDSHIYITTPLESSSYVDMTVNTLSKFGIQVKKTDYGYFIKGNQKYISPSCYKVEGDWSNIAPFMAGAVLNGDITAYNLDLSSKQSDKAILEIIKKFGGEVSVFSDKIIIKKKEANSFNFDMSQCPDLFPVVAVLACGAKGKSLLYNASRLRLKESDRIKSTRALIESLGGKCVEGEDFLEIYGTTYLNGGKCESCNDHRIVMAGAVASVISGENVIISGFEAINKSYPDFIKDFEKTGGRKNVL
ncbi:MAG: 3-phosphoshikimate 1-carboxyvinyltransferase [Clostridia bacterium]|nr:3-phosphoshikimate 1-carboxyvinyltransferase [Clostridia bacterium]